MKETTACPLPGISPIAGSDRVGEPRAGRRKRNDAILSKRLVRKLGRGGASRYSRLQKAKALGLENDPDVRHRYEAMLAGKLEERELQPQLEAIQISTEKLRAAYQKDIARYTRPAKVRLALIWIKTDRKTSAESLLECERRINEARKQKIIMSLQDLSKPAQSVLEMARVDKLFQVSGKNYLPPQQ